MKVEFEIDDIGRDPIHNIFFNKDNLYYKLSKNKLLKQDREMLLECLDIIVDLYTKKYNS